MGTHYFLSKSVFSSVANGKNRSPYSAVKNILVTTQEP